MTLRKQLGLATALAALVPFAAQAAADNWTGATSNAWETGTNWTAGAPTATSAVTIGTTTNNPVQLNSNVSLNGTTGSLTVGAGAAPGTPAVLNINTGDTLTMGARPVTLAGGSITGPGTLSATGTISGYGTISSQIIGTSFLANATDGSNFVGFSPFTNGTPGTPITLIGQSNLTSDTFTVSGHGDFNFQGVTLTTPTLNGVSTNLNAGSIGGNNFYGLFNFTGAASTIVGNVNNTNYQQFDINTLVHLSNFSLTNSWATNVPPFFVIGAGGTLDNSVGNSNLTGHMAVVMNGGAITNSGGGTFTAPGLITGYGSVTGITLASGGITASGGTLTVNGGTGMSVVSAGWGTAGGASDVLDVKGTLNFIAAGGFPAAPALSPGGATLQLDGVTINTTGSAGLIQTGSGQINVASGVNTLNGAFTANGSTGKTANVTVQNGATLSLQNAGGSNGSTGVSEPTGTAAINATNFTLAKGSVLTITGSGNNAISLTGNYVTQQTDKIHALVYNGTNGLGPDLIMAGGTAANPETLATAQTLEVGGIDKGYTQGGFLDNFALQSLTIGPNAYVELVDQYANATTSGWFSGSEALYLDGLFDGVGTATLNLNGLDAYLLGYGQLHNGLYTDAQGDQITIIGARAAVPEPASLAILGLGLAGLGLIRRRRSIAGNIKGGE